MTFLRTVCLCVACCALGTSAALAQTDNAGGIETVVVTAEKRAQDQQRVPIALTAVTSDQIARQHLESAYDLTSVVPALNYGKTFGFTTPFLRGVGTTNTAAGDESSVATYVDGVYQVGGQVAAALPFNNVDHIEVLEGPQGTLYGRNATGGLVNVITKAPSDTFTSNGSVSYGNFDAFEGDAYVSDGITDGIKADLALKMRDQGTGYFKNDFTGNKVGSDSYVTLRSKWDFDLWARAKLELTADYTNDANSTGTTPNQYPGTVPITILIPGTQFTSKPGHFDSVFDPSFSVNTVGVSARLDADFGFADFSSISSYRHISR